MPPVKKRVLLVEGPDDEHVLKHLCGNNGVPHLDKIAACGGVDCLLESLSVRLKASEFGDIVGLIVDADIDIASRWQAVRGRLMGAGYESVPGQPFDDGTILDPPTDKLLPRLGIWIMPDNRSDGILEDFLRFLVPARGAKLLGHVESCVAAIPDGQRLFGPLAEPKAIVHTWLAWQKEPGKPLGTAITARYLDPEVPEVDTLVNWLKRLYLF
ncbi:MAG: hypothetical protein P4L55_10770 [Syntrophobacteraceae bacterium]|nr:hypothetical protein [Syntrophobacteraceae bacterium]